MTKILITLQNSSSIFPKNFARTLSPKISRNTHMVDSGFLPPAAVLPGRRLRASSRHPVPSSRPPGRPSRPSSRHRVPSCRPSGVSSRRPGPIVPVFDVMSFLSSHWFWATLCFNNVLRIGVFLLLFFQNLLLAFLLRTVYIFISGFSAIIPVFG